MNKKRTKVNTKNHNKKRFFSRYTSLTLTFVVIFILQLLLPIGIQLGNSSEIIDQQATSLEVLAQAQENEEEEMTIGDIESTQTEITDDRTEKSDESTEEMTSDEESIEEATIEEETESTNQETNADNNELSSSDPKEDFDENEDKNETNESEKEEVVEEITEDMKSDEETEKETDEEDLVEHLMLDHIPPTTHINPTQALTKFTSGILGSALTIRNNSQKAKNNSSTDLEPGEVRTSKTAQKVDGLVNTWDITVRIEGRDNNIEESTDVVLVIDRSGSMVDNNRMTHAKAAANNFIDTMIPEDPNLRIAIVSYSSDYGGAQLVTINHQFSNNQTSLKNAINSIVALGGTHTQAGIIQGHNLLNGSSADNKFMVLLSDGLPTYSYRPVNWTRRGNEHDGVYDGQYTNQVVGNGSDLTQRFNEGTIFNPIYRNIDNGAAAIRAGTDSKAEVSGLFTIAVSAGPVGTPILEEIASPGMAYSTSNPEELQEIYERIGTQIKTQSAIKNAKIVDEMGDGFTLIDETITTTEGNTSVATGNDTNNQTITWEIKPAVEQLVEGTTDVRYAEMTYRIEINPEILNATVSTPGSSADHDLFKTNQQTLLTYEDIHDSKQEKDIQSPEVDPVLLKIKKTLLDEQGNIVENDPRKFNVQITNDSSSFEHMEELIPGDDYIILTTLRKEGLYNVQEVDITGEGITDLDQFNTYYTIDDVEQSEFIVDHNTQGIPRGDVIIEVTNEIIPSTVSFSFTKVDEEGEPLIGSDFKFERQEADGTFTPIENTGVDPTFMFNELTEGLYILTEIKAPPGYKLPTKTWTIKVIRNEESGLLEIEIPDDSFMTSDPDNGYQVGNETQSTFPQTGGNGALVYLEMGLSILFSGTKIYKKEKNKE